MQCFPPCAPELEPGSFSAVEHFQGSQVKQTKSKKKKQAIYSDKFLSFPSRADDAVFRHNHQNIHLLAITNELWPALLQVFQTPLQYVGKKKGPSRNVHNDEEDPGLCTVVELIVKAAKW